MFGFKDKEKEKTVPIAGSWKGTPVVQNKKTVATSTIGQSEKPTEPPTENPFLTKARSDAANKIAEREKFMEAISAMTPEEKAAILREIINKGDE